jgi:hypothetical protein
VITESAKIAAYRRTREPWGGATVHTEFSELIPDETDAYAVTVKPPGMATVSIPENSSPAEFTAAFNRALEVFGSATYLGVFHDSGKHTVEFDPVEIVKTTDEVDEIARTHPVVGGAYHFATGNGYWPATA